MADAKPGSVEPGNGELARRLDGIMVLLRDLVGRPEYSSDWRLAEHRFTEVEHDLADLRRTHTEDTKDVLRRIELLVERMDKRDEQERKRQEQERTQKGTDWRQFVYQGIWPFAVGVLLIVVTAWITKGGGK